MRVARVVLCSVAVVLAACARSETISAPEEIAWLGVVVVEPQTRRVLVEPSTGLFQRGEPLVIADDEGSPVPTYVVGYRADQLAAFGAPQRQVRRDDHLRAASRCGNRLPAPAWAARFGAQTGVRVLGAGAPELPPLTTGWIEDVCPPGPGTRAGIEPTDTSTLSLLLSCSDHWCEHHFVATGACRFRVDFSALCVRASAIAGLTGAVDASGRLCLEPAAGCEAAASPRAYAVDTLSCTEATPTGPIECELDLRKVNELPAQVTRAKIVPGAREVPPQEHSWPVSLDVLPWGHLWDLLPVGDQLVVTGHGLPLSRYFSCTSPHEPTNVTILDAETMQVTSRFTAPPCLTRLVPDVGKEGRGTFIGVDGDAGLYHVRRYDLRGQIYEETPIEVPEAAQHKEYIYSQIIDAVGTRDPPTITVLVGQIISIAAPPEVMAERRERVVFLDAATLARTATICLGRKTETSTVCNERESRGVALVESGSGAVAVLDDKVDILRRYALDRRGPRETFALNLNPGRTLSNAVYLPSADHWLVGAIDSDVPTLFVVEPTATAARRGFPPDAEEAPTAITRWPPNPGLGLVGLVRWPAESDPPRAIVRLVDPRTGPDPPVVMPDQLDLGYGLISRFRTDARGRVWALLPWAAEVVRITPER